MVNISYVNLTLIKRIGCNKRTKKQNREQKDKGFLTPQKGKWQKA